MDKIICIFMQLGTHVESSEATREVQWLIYESCECTLPYEFSVQDGYYTCTASDYVIYRAKLSTPYESSHSVDMASLKANLSNFFTRQDERTPITMNGGRYFIEPGPCGLTVPQLNSPHCRTVHPGAGCCFHLATRQRCHQNSGHHECFIGSGGAWRVHCIPCHWTADNVSKETACTISQCKHVRYSQHMWYTFMHCVTLGTTEERKLQK